MLRRTLNFEEQHDGSAVIDADAGGGGFCPPGQAKRVAARQPAGKEMHYVLGTMKGPKPCEY
jgi:hypothetical protein